MTTISTTAPVAVAVVAAIQNGDLAALRALLAEHPDLPTTRLGDDDPDGMSRSLLHVVADWPGHFPGGAATVATLVAAGADVNARFHGPHAETPLHWAASSDDVAVLDALLDAGADIEAPGSVLGGGPPLKNATGFKQWHVAHRLVERGANVDLSAAASLGLVDRLSAPADANTINHALWSACHAGQLPAAQLLVARGGDVNWLPPWENVAPLDAATGSGELVEWLRAHGARSAT
jgi:ankyrin repeat protein